MDIASLVGLVLALIGVFVGMVMKGVPFSALDNPAAFLIIFVGTFGAVFVATPFSQIKNVGKLFGVIFGNKKMMTQQDAITEIVKYAEMARKDGLLSLEAIVGNVTDPFMKRALGMINLGCSPEYLEETLVEDIQAMQERHASNAQIFTQAGTYAPTLGVLGAVVGLIAALGNMADVDALGHAISAAFVATLLGIFTGYCLWHPFANKLREKSKAEALSKYVVVKGVVAMLNGENPRMIQEKLFSHISDTQRKKMPGGNEA